MSSSDLSNEQIFQIIDEKISILHEKLKKFVILFEGQKEKEIYSTCNSLFRINMWTKAKILSLKRIHFKQPSEILEAWNILDDHDREAYVNSCEMFDRISTLTLFMFQVERLINNLLVELGIKKPYGFRKKLSKLILLLPSLENSERIEKLILSPSLLRNSLHSGGTHKDNIEMTIEYGGYTFEYVNNTQPKGRWDYILMALLGLVESFEKILETKEVQSKLFP